MPIKGTMSFAADPTGGTIDCTTPYGTMPHPQVVDFHGIISHLGKTSTVDTVSDCSLTLTGMFVEHVQYVHTAANGDQTYGTGEVTVNVATGEMTFTAEATGGTGRFVGVTGSVSGGGMADLATGTGTLSFSGWMSSVGSSK